MSAADLAAVLIGVASIVVAVGFVVVLYELRRTVADVRAALERVTEDVIPVIERLDGTVEQMSEEIHRVDGLLDTAETVSARADTLSRVTYKAIARPVIKTAAVISGTAKGARHLRGGQVPDEEERVS